MKFLNTLRKIEMIRFGIGMIVVGLLFSVIAGAILLSPKGEYAEVEAVIVDCQEEWDDETTTYVYHLDYEVNGQKYSDVECWGDFGTTTVGDRVTVEYNVGNPAEIRTPGGEFLPYIFLVIGIVVLIAGIALLARRAGKPSSEMNEYDRVDMSGVTEDMIAEVRDSDEPRRNYIFHFDRKIKQGYVMETEERETVYEGKMIKLTFFKPFTFDFINHLTGRTETKQIGHTVSTSIGASGGNFSYRVPIRSSFKIDGENNWDYLARAGYGFDFRMEGIKPCFTVRHFGVPVAEIETAGTNILREGANNPIGKLPVNGLFKVSCRASDLDMIFMICFCISRAIFYEN